MRQAAAVEVGAIFGADVFQAIFAAMGVWIHTAIGTRSMLLAAMAVVQAVLAVPVAHFFYRLIFQVRAQRVSQHRRGQQPGVGTPGTAGI